MKNTKLTYISLLSALAIIFGYIESLLPAFVAIPGIKLGVSNIVVLFALYRTNKSSAFFIMFIKVFVTSLLFSGMNVLFYSLCGGILSLCSMILFRRFNMSVIGVSAAGGIFHNVGQLFAAGIMLGTSSVIYYFPVLLISGLTFGIITGTVCKIIISRLNKIQF